MRGKKIKQTTYSSFPAEKPGGGDRCIQPGGGGSGVDPTIPQAEAPFGKTFKSPKK